MGSGKFVREKGERKGVMASVKDEGRKDSKAGWWYHLSSVFVCVVYQVRDDVYHINL